MTVIKIKKTKIRNLKNLKKRLMKPLFGQPLPKDIVNLIFSFDGTYRNVMLQCFHQLNFNKCLNEYAKGCYQAPKFGYKNRVESYKIKLDNYGKRFIKNKKYIEEKTAVWVDSKYTGFYGKGKVYYNEDTNKMEPVNLYYNYYYGYPWVPDTTHDLVRSKENEFNSQVPYSITYENTKHKCYIGAGKTDEDNKHTYTYNALSQSVNYGFKTQWEKTRRKQKWVKQFLKNIKKFKKWHPNLCDY